MSRFSDVDIFIHTLRGARTAHDIHAIVGSMTREMGFHSFTLVQHAKNFSRENKRFLAVSNFSEAWIDHYLEHRLHEHDPLYAATRQTTMGFRFDEVASLIRITGRQEETREAGRREGITDGFCVPSHVPGEDEGSCTFVMRNNKPLPTRNLALAQLVGNFAYEAARRLWRQGVCFIGPEFRGAEREREDSAQFLAIPRGPTLTTRQLECILLMARGKTDWEISKILGLHEQTVTQHLNEARRRCGVSRRTELAIHALYHGHLTFDDILN